MLTLSVCYVYFEQATILYSLALIIELNLAHYKKEIETQHQK